MGRNLLCLGSWRRGAGVYPYLQHENKAAMFNDLAVRNYGISQERQRDWWLNGDKPKRKLNTEFQEDYRRSEALVKCLWEAAKFSDETTLSFQQYASVQPSKQHSTPVGWRAKLVWSVWNSTWSAGISVDSASYFSLTVLNDPSCSVLTVGDGSEFVTEKTRTAKLVPNESVSFFSSSALPPERQCPTNKGWAHRCLPEGCNETDQSRGDCVFWQPFKRRQYWRSYPTRTFCWNISISTQYLFPS